MAVIMITNSREKEINVTEPESAYGLWSLVIINSLIFIFGYSAQNVGSRVSSRGF